jgi:arylesterase/paraoxonase
MLRFAGWAFLLPLVAMGVWGYFLCVDAGVFLTIPPKAVGFCSPVLSGGVVGVEDLAIDEDTHLAYLSGYDRREQAKGAPVRGAIWVYDLQQQEAAPVDMTAGALPEGFLPHGISLFRGADGKRTLFAVNHAGGKHTIEIFDVDGKTLTHRQTVSGDALVSPNDVVGVGPDSFYVTNDHAYVSGWMRTVEDFGRFRVSTVQYFDGKIFMAAIRGLGGSNGINVSSDGKSLYVSAASERTVYAYDRNLQTGALTRRSAVEVPGFPDNIDVESDGNLLVAVHSKIFELLAHAQDPAKLSPSHIMLLTADGKGGFTPKTIYYNNGEEISGASVAAAYGPALLIGSIFEHKILSCYWKDRPGFDVHD